MSEYWFKIGIVAPTGSVWPKISGRRGCPTNHSSCQKTRVNGLSCGIQECGHKSLSFCHNPRVWQTDRRTDGKALENVRCITCSHTVKIEADRSTLLEEGSGRLVAETNFQMTTCVRTSIA